MASRGGGGNVDATPDPAPVLPAAPDAQPPPPLFPALCGALVRGDAADAAASLRKELRTDADARRRAEDALLDPLTPREVRIALAWVLGTIGASDDRLLDALERFRDDGELARSLLLALGATREPADDDDIFGLGDRPWGSRGPAGLGITVRRPIEDESVRAVVAGFLGHEEDGVRHAAAQALRHSLDQADARNAFLGALGMESVDDVALEVGEALAEWAGSAGEASERAAVMRRLLTRAADEGLDGYRFRLEDDLSRVALAPAERIVLEEYAHPSHPFSLRTFALTVLATGAARSGETAVERARALLMRTAAADPDGAARDLAARLLPRLDYDIGTARLLARIARDDPAWNLRYTCTEALAEFGARPEVLAALQAAASDPDQRVAGRARELHDRLAGG